MKYNLGKMKTLDIYLQNLPKDEYSKISKDVSAQKSASFLSWEFFVNGFKNLLKETKKKTDLSFVADLAKEFGWKNDLGKAFSKYDYEALIITDKNQKIIWVNDGFKPMTGYCKKYAIDKKPSFLQGELTSKETKDRINKKISLDKPFRDEIINHRKDNTTYKCEINIIPLFGKETTHYMAFERQIA